MLECLLTCTVSERTSRPHLAPCTRCATLIWPLFVNIYSERVADSQEVVKIFQRGQMYSEPPSGYILPSYSHLKTGKLTLVKCVVCHFIILWIIEPPRHRAVPWPHGSLLSYTFAVTWPFLSHTIPNPGQPLVCSSYRQFCISRMSCKWNHTECYLLGPAFLVRHNALETGHSHKICTCWCLIVFYDWVVLRDTNVPQWACNHFLVQEHFSWS